jgi:MYXO-CTERM domain-containing protein
MAKLEPHDRVAHSFDRTSPIRSLAPVGPDSDFAPPLPSTPVPALVPGSGVRRAVGVGVACVILGAAAVAGSRLDDRRRSPTESIAHVVSGTAGVRTTAQGVNEKWPDGRVTVVIDGSVGDLGKTAADVVKAAFGTWAASGANLPALMFDVRDEHGKAAHDGVNRVLVAPITISGHEKDVAVTIGYADDATGEIEEADVILNSAYHFSALANDAADDADEGKADCALRYDVQNIVTHEGGHFFGLGEDLTDLKASMYYRSSPCQTHKRILTEADRGVMASLYKPASATGPVDPKTPVAAKSMGCASSPGSPAGDLLAVVVVAMAGAAVLARRRRDSRRTLNAAREA